MIYFLRHKKTKEFAKLHFTAMDEYELSVDIGSGGQTYYSTDSFIKALMVLSQSADRYSCDADSPMWDTESFGNDYEIVSSELSDPITHSYDKFISVLDIIDNKKCMACFMVDISEEKANQIEVDHTLTDDTLFPDKISYKYQVFLINYTDEKFNDLVGKMVFLDSNPYSLNYVHAIIDQHKAIGLNLINPKNEDFTMLLVSRVTTNC